MPKQSKPASRSCRRGGSGGGAGKILLGVLIGMLLSAAGIVAYFRFGNPPVAVADRAALWEPLVTKVPVQTRANGAAKTPPFSASEDVFEAAAKTYRGQCAQCHGPPGHDAPMATRTQPRSPQFFGLRDRKIIAAEPVGEIYWKTAFGIRRSGMPAYNHTLTDTQMWQLSLLLHAVNEDLPDPVKALLTQGNPQPQPSTVLP
jgi:thiosulfate dehydrogenase